MNYSNKMRFLNRDLTSNHFKAVIPALLSNLPKDWYGTTFKNHDLLGRGKFGTNLSNLLLTKDHDAITSEDLGALGNAEDYLRVSSNISTILEAALAVERDLDVTEVFSFGSTTMPVIAVLLTAAKPVHMYVGENGDAPFTSTQMNTLKLLGCDLTVHQSLPSERSDTRVTITNLQDSSLTEKVDGVIAPNVLYIINPETILSNSILTIRKRMSTPVTTPVAIEMLRQYAGLPVQDSPKPTGEELAAFYAHLQTMSGTPANASANPACFTAGLPSIASLWVTLVGQGGADVLMASTAYGGSSQLTDLLCDKTEVMTKHTYDITGSNDISAAIQGALTKLAGNAQNLHPRTVLFVEIPTNPDMKIPDMKALAEMLTKYREDTQKDVLLLMDTTFAPGSRVMELMSAHAPNLTMLTFISMSKSVSRGLTTAGALVCGSSDASVALLGKVKDTAQMLDVSAKRDQMRFLVGNHEGVEARCQKAYTNAVLAGNALKEVVAEVRDGYEMGLNFVTEKQAALGFHTSTFSFNLPVVKNGTASENAALAQKFTDLLQQHDAVFKPCVSFGQDNGLVYATVPATSTQGAIKEEDKAKQAVGGVQLCRLSFPPTIDMEKVCGIIRDAVRNVY
ncbi:hypothetical protein SARC_12713 [Sphaeroforma arctica JP610]|uniref:Cystathionine beta-synthase n=1 Tax=Sphaeroforma arctica JP610 TaxID=667725 RepID=A0A0L0FFD4_9EUKA|nr:hypothetical protein SARC_12713 [Sphaeroforma arctica JP610]KNC74748.1 hypothetical protein SARC_12713 [Sphaeroforma arctica JP610]|eukprot:XP_014148650.1 hypothetical protein SARC_12713 [Sphaeroforma arctica JP610]